MVENEIKTSWLVEIGEPLTYVGLIVLAIVLSGGGDPNSPKSPWSAEVAGSVVTVTGGVMWLLGSKTKINIGRNFEF